MKNLNLSSGVSKFISLLVILFLLVGFSLSVQAEAQDYQNEIDEYLEQVEAAEQSFFFSSILADLSEEDELALETIFALIDEYAAGEIPADSLHEGVHAIIEAQRVGVSAAEIDEINGDIADEADHGQAVAEKAQELAEYAADEENDGEAVSEQAQELAETAAEKGEEKAEESEKSEDKPVDVEIPENNNDNSED